MLNKSENFVRNECIPVMAKFGKKTAGLGRE